MYLQVLKNIINSRSLHKADVARLAGVSRAAVTKWFREVRPDGSVNIESRTLFQLASGLGVSVERLVKPTPDLTPYRSEFLWDSLYPSMEDFVQALIRNQLPALARLVQEIGFSEAKHIVGKKAILQFPQYKKYIKPIRREQLEILWPLYVSRR